MDSTQSVPNKFDMCIISYSFSIGSIPLWSVLLLLLCVRLLFWTRVKSQELERRNIILAEPSIHVLKVVRRFQYLWKGPEILRKVHVKDTPYAIRTPEAYQVQFSSREHIKQLMQAPDTHLSLHALAKDMFQPKYTMYGLDVDDCMSENGTIHQRALQAELRSHLPALTQPLSDCIARVLNQEMTNSKALPGGWHTLQVFPMAKRLITAANALVFFGPEVSSDPVFLSAALEYPERLMGTAEVLRLVPSWLAPFVAPYLMSSHGVLKILIDRLTPVVETCLLDATSSTTAGRKKDCIQFFANAVVRKKQQHEWPALRIVQVLLGIWFASVHQPAMCLFYALDDLCLHPEYTTELREEISHATCQAQIASLPLLNGFLKESARLNSTDSISLRRKVLHPFTLHDGTSLAKGDIACVPLQSILRDTEFYTDPLTFNPYRFMNMNKSENVKPGNSMSDFTDADIAFPVWGLGKRACPGRYYTSLLLKLILARVLLRYELRMPDGNKRDRRYFYWRSAIVPKTGAVLKFREREQDF